MILVIKLTLIMSKNRRRIYIGTDRWGRKEWVGTLYPKSAKDKDFIKYYTDTLDFIEFQYSRYKIITPDQITEYIKVFKGKNFKICPHLIRHLHQPMYSNPQKLKEEVINSLSIYRNIPEYFGVVLIDTWIFKNVITEEGLFRLISNLPSDYSIVLTIDKSHERKLLDDDFFKHLNDHKVGLVLNDHTYCLAEKLSSPVIYFKVDAASPVNLEKMLSKIRNNVKEVYISVVGEDKAMVGEVLLEYLKLRDQY